MTRRTLDVVVPALYAIAVVLTALIADGRPVVIVAIVGAMLVGLYYSAIRRSLPQPPRSPDR
jgi:hypothetical protein